MGRQLTRAWPTAPELEAPNERHRKTQYEPASSSRTDWKRLTKAPRDIIRARQQLQNRLEATNEGTARYNRRKPALNQAAKKLSTFFISNGWCADNNLVAVGAGATCFLEPDSGQWVEAQPRV